MDAERWTAVSRLFLSAVDEDPADWEGYLARRCGDDVSLKTEVLAMLRASEDPEPFGVERFVSGDPTTGSARSAGDLMGASRYRRRDGEKIGAYHLTDLIGQGGMSDVYRAVRPFGDYQQTVAIKVLAVGLRGPEALARFKAEGEILARLNHPNIARLLDGGATDDGVPYLVMEYVDGLPITEFCDHRNLLLDERLRIFSKVCTAVRFAHANLVVHRDLKPSNVLVTPEGEVRLLDFGIAKLLDLESGGPALATRADVRLMTPEYASPEQIAGATITTATDVYGLGLLLYELLAGRHPYQDRRGRSRKDLEQAVLRGNPTPLSLAATTPPAPSSTRAPAAREWAERVAARRGLDSRQLGRQLAGDLETIVRTALHLDPERRYPSPVAIADDIERHRRLQPIRARGDSFPYRTGKFVRRNRAMLAVTGILGTAVLAFATSTVLQSQALTVERDRAELEATKARETRDFMLGLFSAADPLGAGRDTLRVYQILEEGAQRADRELAGQPELQGALLGAIGEAFRGLQRRDEASELLGRAAVLLSDALGPDHVETLAAQRRYLAALAAQRRLDDVERVGTAYLAAAASVLPANDPDLLAAHATVSTALHELGNLEASDSLFEAMVQKSESVEWPDSADVGQLFTDQGRRYWVKRDYEAADAMVARAIRTERAMHGPSHVAVAMALNARVPILWSLGRFSQAEESGRRAINIFEDTYPDGHRLLGSAKVMLGQSLVHQERYDEVEGLYNEAFAMYERIEGPDFPGIGEVHRRLGHLARAQGRPLDAIPHYQRATELYESLYGSEGLMAVEHRQHVAEAYIDARQFREAEDILGQECSTLERTRGNDNQFTQECRWRTVTLYEKWGRPAEAERQRARTTIPDRRAP